MSYTPSTYGTTEKIGNQIVPKYSVSTFDKSHTIKTTFNSGKLIPLTWEHILPGDSLKLNVDAIIRMVSPATQILDNARITFHAFFVPTRLIFDEFINFMGESNTAWISPNPPETVPLLTGPDSTFEGYTEHDLAAYLGLPQYVNFFKNNNSIDRLPFNAYILIFNDWYRDINLQDNALMIPNGNLDISNRKPKSTVDKSWMSNLQFGLELAPVSKFNDYFTSCLPNTQRGDAVSILELIKLNVEYNTTDSAYSSLIATANGSTQALTINDLRESIALQQFRELSARGGNRYIELVYNMFGVDSADLRTQRAQYLGGWTQMMQIETVSATTTDGKTSEISSGLGAFGSHSTSVVMGDNDIECSFTEHGIFMLMVSIRPENSYSQGIDKKWNLKTKLDYYYPTFDHIGEQPIYQSELYVDENTEIESKVFGYNEAWANYRYSLNKSTGFFSSNSKYTYGYQQMTFTSNFNESPVLNAAFIEQSPATIGKVLSLVDYNKYHQFYGIFYIKMYFSRIMSVQSTPGLTRI